MPEVASSIVDCSGVGAKRTCTLQDGTKIFEKLVSLDETSRALQYAVTKSTMPLDDYVGTIKVQGLGDSRCAVEFSGAFRVSGMPEADMVAMIAGMYLTAIEGLEKLHAMQAV